MNFEVFLDVSRNCSRITTELYSTSFASAIRLLHSDLRQPIHNIYGFVRFADEIVDTFHDYDKAMLLARFRRDTYSAIEEGISLNPILNSFQQTVNRFSIDIHLIDAFFHSMQMDLQNFTYDEQCYNEYIYGSAEVVGLMCLQVFCEGNKELYARLEPHARSLGAAFQKVNFLRDINADFQQLSRTYFPGIDFNKFDLGCKKNIEADIEADFSNAYRGIVALPWKARFGVYVAYKYYISLFNKIKKVQPSKMMQQRIRIPNFQKAMIIARAGVKNQLKLI
jgi:15-cis-phytoene synthase